MSMIQQNQSPSIKGPVNPSAIENDLRETSDLQEFVMNHLARHAGMLAADAMAADPPRATRVTLPFPAQGSRPLLRYRFGEEWIPVQPPEDVREAVCKPVQPFYDMVPSIARLADGRELVRIIDNCKQIGQLGDVTAPALIIRRDAFQGSGRSLPVEFRQIQACVRTLYLETPPTLREIDGLARVKGLRHLYLAATSPLDLEALAALPELESLTLIGCRLPRGLLFLRDVDRLQRLRIVRAHGLERLHGAQEHPNLRHLSIEDCAITKVHQLNRMPVLTSVSLDRCGKLQRLPDFSGDNPIRELVIRNCTRLEQTSFLSGSRRLSRLELSGMEGLHIGPALRLQGLTTLRIPNMAIDDQNLEQIGRLRNIQHLDLSFNHMLTNLQPLARLTLLTRFKIDCCQNVSSLEPLGKLKHLSDLSIAFCFGLDSIWPIQSMEKMQHLQLTGLPASLQKPELIPLMHLEALAVNCWYTMKSVDFTQFGRMLTFLDVRNCPLIEDAGYLREHRGRMLVFTSPTSQLAKSLGDSNPTVNLGPWKVHQNATPWFDLPRQDNWNHLAWRSNQPGFDMSSCYEFFIEKRIIPDYRRRISEIQWAEGTPMEREASRPVGERELHNHPVKAGGSPGNPPKATGHPGPAQANPSGKTVTTGTRGNTAPESGSKGNVKGEIATGQTRVHAGHASIGGPAGATHRDTPSSPAGSPAMTPMSSLVQSSKIRANGKATMPKPKGTRIVQATRKGTGLSSKPSRAAKSMKSPNSGKGAKVGTNPPTRKSAMGRVGKAGNKLVGTIRRKMAGLAGKAGLSAKSQGKPKPRRNAKAVRNSGRSTSRTHR